MSDARPAWSITDFLTTGSLAALVEELGRLIGCDITLHAIDGRHIRSVDGDPPWRIDQEPRSDLGRHIATRLTHDTISHLNGRSIVPLQVAGAPVGTLVIDLPAHTADARRAEIERLLTLVSETAAEFCDENVENRQHTSNLALLLRISSLLVSTRGLDHSLQIAIDASMKTFSADAATVHLLDEERSLLMLRAGGGLSDEFMQDFAELPCDRVIDQDVLEGDVICVPDLAQRGTAPHLDRIQNEGLRGLASVGLLFQNDAFGIMRLYTRRELHLTEDERALLRAVAEQISGAIAGTRLIESERRHREHQRALGLAADIQRRMLPLNPPRVQGLQVAARYIPSLALGGDFYDLIEFDRELGIVVGDVVGKGIPAALLMASVRSSIRAHATDPHHIDEVIRRVNIALARDTHPNEFATLFYGVIDPTNLNITYCNAGHDPPLVIRHAAPHQPPEIFRLDEGGMVVGVIEDAPYTPATFQLKPGDLLVAYTDGLTDTMNFHDEKLGIERVRTSLAELLAATPAPTAEHTVSHLVWEASRFAGLRPKIDDLTIVCARIED